MLINIYHFL